MSLEGRGQSLRAGHRQGRGFCVRIGFLLPSPCGLRFSEPWVLICKTCERPCVCLRRLWVCVSYKPCTDRSSCTHEDLLSAGALEPQPFLFWGSPSFLANWLGRCCHLGSRSVESRQASRGARAVQACQRRLWPPSFRPAPLSACQGINGLLAFVSGSPAPGSLYSKVQPQQIPSFLPLAVHGQGTMTCGWAGAP